VLADRDSIRLGHVSHPNELYREAPPTSPWRRLLVLRALPPVPRHMGLMKLIHSFSLQRKWPPR
jgi:hypothetical protein